MIIVIINEKLANKQLNIYTTLPQLFNKNKNNRKLYIILFLD